MSCRKQTKNGLLWSRSQQNFKMSMNVCLEQIFWTTEKLITKLGMVLHHHEPVCLAKRLLCCLQDQGHSVLLYLLNYWFFCNQTLVWWHMIVSWVVLWKDCIAVFVLKVKVTAKIQNFIEFSSGPYILNCWTTCNQTWYGDASLWARQSCEKIALLSSRSRSQWELVNKCDCFYHIC